MGSTARGAGSSGASHPMAVNETVIAMLRPKPDMAKPPTTRPTSRPPPRPPSTHRTASARSPRTGPRVPLPATGTWNALGKGGAQADIVLTAPQDQVPLQFTEVDNCHETAEELAGVDCNSAAAYVWTYDSATQHLVAGDGHCLGVWDVVATKVVMEPCSDTDADQRWGAYKNRDGYTSIYLTADATDPVNDLQSIRRLYMYETLGDISAGERSYYTTQVRKVSAPDTTRRRASRCLPVA
jgi:hypothetical protein